MIDNQRVQPHAIMLVANGCTDDSRVLKQAAAVRKAGFSVTIYADIEKELPVHEIKDGLHFSRFNSRAKYTKSADHAFEAAYFITDPKQAADRQDLRHIQSKIWCKRLFWRTTKVVRSLLILSSLRKKLKNSIRALRSEISNLKATRRQTEKRIHSYVTSKHLRYLRNFAAHYAAIGAKPKPAVIHAHDLYTLPAGLFLAQRTGAKLIYDAHEYEQGRYGNFTPQALEAFGDMENRMFPKIDRMITVGAKIADLYGARFQGEHPTIIYNTPIIARHSSTQHSQGGLREATRLPPSVPLLIFTGRVHGEGRGLNIVVEALKTMPEVHLAILGQRVQSFDDWLMDAARIASVDGRLHLIPAVAPDAVVDMIRDADAGLCLIQDASISYRFCMPNKLFEMTFANLPLVVSKLPELAGFVEELGNGLAVDQTDPQDVARGIKDVLGQPDAYALSTHAQKRLEQHYSWQAQERRLSDLYHHLLKPQSASKAA